MLFINNKSKPLFQPANTQWECYKSLNIYAILHNNACAQGPGVVLYKKQVNGVILAGVLFGPVVEQKQQRNIIRAVDNSAVGIGGDADMDFADMRDGPEGIKALYHFLRIVFILQPEMNVVYKGV